MIFNKKFEDITFDDVQEMVVGKVEEGIRLDYKQEFGESKKVAKLVCAFANTYGGYIVFGVSEEENTNKPDKIVGLDISDKVLASKFDSLCIQEITPPIMNAMTKIIENEDSSQKVMIAFIPESDLTPHAIDGNRLVYIKVGAQKEPIAKSKLEIATVPEVRWLENRRQKFVEFRKQLVRDGESKLPNLSVAIKVDSLGLSVTVCPQFPRTELVEHSNFASCLELFLERHRQQHAASILSGRTFRSYDRGMLISTQRSQVRIDRNINCFGFASTTSSWPKYGIDSVVKPDGNKYIDPLLVVRLLIDGLALPLRFLEETEYLGSVIVEASLYNFRHCKLRAEWDDGRELSELLDSESTVDRHLRVDATAYKWDSHDYPIEFGRMFISRLLSTCGVTEGITRCADQIMAWGSEAYFGSSKKQLVDTSVL